MKRVTSAAQRAVLAALRSAPLPPLLCLAVPAQTRPYDLVDNVEDDHVNLHPIPIRPMLFSADGGARDSRAVTRGDSPQAPTRCRS